LWTNLNLVKVGYRPADGVLSDNGKSRCIGVVTHYWTITRRLIAIQPQESQDLSKIQQPNFAVANLMYLLIIMHC
jgi:hypothetical protein